MFNKKTTKKEAKGVVHVEDESVTLHLDVDPNDPRNRKPAEALPSLDD